MKKSKKGITPSYNANIADDAGTTDNTYADGKGRR